MAVGVAPDTQEDASSVSSPARRPPDVLIVGGTRGANDSARTDRRARFELHYAADEEHAWHTLVITPSIRVIISDMETVARDDCRLLHRMRASKLARIRCLPVVIRSGDPEDDAGNRIRALGAAEFVTSHTPAKEAVQRLAVLLGDGELAKDLVDAEVVDAGAAAGPPPEEPRAGSDAPMVHSNPNKEMPMSRVDELNRVLKHLQNQSPGVEASALISEDGLIIASALAQGLDETRVAGMTATLLSLGTRASTELRRGAIQEVIVRGEQGYAVMIGAGRGAVLLVLATAGTALGLILFDMRETIGSLQKIL